MSSVSPTPDSSQPEASSNNETNGDLTLEGNSPQELITFTESVFQQLQSKFDDFSTNLVTKIDEMGSRIDSLEKSLGELLQQAEPEEIINDEKNPI
ncbi:5974_t:CDS:2 [Diversispora eburnea]|uniref:5974_t:CDS:1 n=1 Tax=Diversispora eburnea TaxID=1213867 RepID=A0A9N9C1H6_9GLOM|nr:5974_t:CDS:2 [Diversispora eburnea]